MALEAKEPINKLERILVVEDDPDYREEYANALRKRGIDVVSVSSAGEAIEALKKGKFTRIITDGLRGRCKTVVELAQEKKLPIKVISNNPLIEYQLQEQGIKGFTFIDKSSIFMANDPTEELMKL